MNWVVVGQGAIGLLWYHHLSLTNKIKVTDGDNMIDSLRLLASQRQKISQNHYSFTSLDNQVYRGTINFAQKEQLQKPILYCFA
jgi:2-dehydropantoate 2-reductase